MKSSRPLEPIPKEMTATAIMEYAIKCGQKWERRGMRIITFATGEVEHFRSYNAAKKASRKLQGAKQGYAGMRILK